MQGMTQSRNAACPTPTLQLYSQHTQVAIMLAQTDSKASGHGRRETTLVEHIMPRACAPARALTPRAAERSNETADMSSLEP